jgi:CSLREA domain-containing protein
MTQRPIALALRPIATRVSGRPRSPFWLAAAVFLATFASSANAAVLIVNTDDDTREDRCDARHCTLREAIQAANKLPRGAEIRFALPVSPYRIDVDVNWALKNAAQICARVKTNLPTPGLRFMHLNGDARLFWATAEGWDPWGNELGTAPPHNWDEFLRRVNLWNNFGAPCP